ncbi:hypothetical protein ACQPZZ_29090 [Microbispora sp. CA-135349]|uniref:hypothetical protein n=1 Tax=Microbispora sp. CA-135349 TaxID=3239953 RepID=UPI003D8C9E80
MQRVCRVRVSVTDVREWPTRTGYDIHADLPGAGSTRAHLAAAADALAVDARLPMGCGVEISPGAHRGAVVLRVATVNRLTQNIDYPADYRARSILDPVALGEYRDGSTAAVLLRESSALVTGQKGSGKTTTLHALTAGIGLCRDAIVWHIDLNGGGMSQAWLHPWLEGDSPRPAVDWAAATPDEALELAETARAIAKDRKKSTRALKIRANSSLMPVSPELPEIVVIVDEGAESLSPTNRDTRELREALEEIQRIGRNEAVNVVFSSLRATQDMISANVKKQSAVRVGMYVTDEEELSFLFGWSRRGLSLADLPGPGCGFVQDGQAAPRPFRGYFMQPGDVVDAAHAVARTRPELDAAARQVAGQVYATRYDRMRAAFTDLDGEHQEEPPARYVTPAPVAPVRPRLASVPCGPDASAWPDLRDLVKPPAAPSMTRAADWPDLLPRQRRPEVVRAEQVPAVPAAPAPARPLPEVLRRALAAYEAAGDDRMHSAALAEALGAADALALAALLRPLGVTTLPRAFIRGGTEARGYALADLQAAAERVCSGELEVPDEVAKWPAA